MKKATKGANRILTLGASLARRAWPSIVLFLLAGVMIGSGVYLKSRPDWNMRSDIREYNRGVLAYQELLWAPLVSSEELLLSAYPHAVEIAGPHFENAGSESSDKKLVSMSYYNLGTMIGKQAFLSERLRSTRALDVAQAIIKLGQAIRADPHNEDAKFNLELLQGMLTVEEQQEGGPGEGYAPGVVGDKGY